MMLKVTEEQKRAIESHGSLAVIASAGTGKTTVLTQRFLYTHLERSFPLHQLLAFTFTEKASREMMSRILESKKIPYVHAPLLNISTIHSFCQRLLKQHGVHLGLSSDFEVYDEESHAVWQDSMIASFVSESLESKRSSVVNFFKYYGYQNLKSAIRYLLKQDLINLDKDHLVCVNDSTDFSLDQMNAFLVAVSLFHEELLQHKIKNQILSYDDLEVLTIKLIEEHTHVLKRIQTQYKQILVDEYQDISPRQFRIIKSLFNPEENEIFIVGDPKQSIYGFRDADVRLFYEMVSLIENHGGQTIYLTKTFRTPELLQKYFNKVFPFVLPDFKDAKTVKVNYDTVMYRAKIPSDKKNTEDRHVHYAHEVADRVQSLIANGTKPEEIAVLFFASLPIPIYQEALQTKGIKTVTQTQTHLFEVPVVLVTWQILKYLAGERDRVTQVGIMRNEVLAFSETFIDQLLKEDSEDVFHGKTVDLFSHERDHEGWNSLLDHLIVWKGLSQTLFVTELFQTIVDDLCPKLSVQEAFFVQNFLKILESWQKEGLYYLPDVIGALKALGAHDSAKMAMPAHPEGVHLFTIHGAKGLEFEHVFLVPGRGKNRITPVCLYQKNKGFVFKKHDCENEKALQYQLEESESYALVNDDSLKRGSEELARLIYVALTRASHSLYFFVDQPSQQLMRRFAGDAENTRPIKTYNEWLYWLACIIDPDRLTTKNVFQDVFHKIQESQEQGLDFAGQVAFSFSSMTKPSYTVTELEIFNHCPKRFQLKYVQNIVPVLDLERQTMIKKELSQRKAHLKPSERGNLFHEILQYYDFQEGKNLDDVIDQALFNQHIVLPSEAIRTECHLFINRLKQDPVIYDILFENHQSYAEVEFSLQMKDFVLIGQIDRLVQLAGGAHDKRYMIIDYKTHHAPGHEKQDALLKQFHFQMSCYALAMLRSLEVSAIETLVLFTAVPTCRTIRHTTESLKIFESRLNEDFARMQTGINDEMFALTQDQSHCMNCPYFSKNYCGVKISSS